MKCVLATSFLLSTGAISNAGMLPALTMNVLWFTDEKLLIASALSNLGGMKSGVSRARNSIISRSLCAGELSCWNVYQSNYPQRCVKVIVLCVSWGCNGKTSTVCHQWIRWSWLSLQGSYAATDNTGWDKQACCHLSHFTMSALHLD